MSMTETIADIEHRAFERMNRPFANSLVDYRCTCGRLLGRFNGQAEVKCPKCGKMNMIGVENCGKS